MNKLDNHREKSMSRDSDPYKEVNWSKLKRFWDRMVGHHIGDVYSDFKESDFVPAEFKNWKRFTNWLGGDFYVDENDILRKEARIKKVPKPKPNDFIPISEHVQLSKEGGIWYYIELKTSISVYNWFKGCSMVKILVENPKMLHYTEIRLSRWTYPRELILKKKQLSKSELRKWGIEND